MGRLDKFTGVVAGEGSRLSVSAILSVFAAGVGAAGRFGLTVVLARLLSGAEYGIYATMRRLAELLATVPNRGYLGSIVRFLPDYSALNQWALYRGLRRRALAVTVGGALLIWAGATAFGVLYSDWSDHKLAAVLAMAAIPAWAAFRMLQAILQAEHQFVLSSYVDQIGQPVVMGIVLGIVWLAGRTLDLNFVFGALLFSVVMAVVASLISVRMSEPSSVKGRRLAAENRQQDLPRWGSVAKKFFVGQLSISVLGTVDILILALFVEPGSVGLYSIGARIAFLGRMIHAGVDSIVSPRIAAAWTKENLAELQRTVDNAIILVVPPTILLAALLVIFRNPVLRRIEAEYVEAGGLMMILLIGVVVQALTGPNGYVVSLTNNEDFHAKTMAAAAVFLVVACFIAAPLGGIVAVALAVTITTIVWNVVLVVFAKRKLGIRCYPSPSLFAQRLR